MEMELQGKKTGQAHNEGDDRGGDHLLNTNVGLGRRWGRSWRRLGTSSGGVAGCRWDLDLAIWDLADRCAGGDLNLAVWDLRDRSATSSRDRDLSARGGVSLNLTCEEPQLALTKSRGTRE
jgi:hypothetical protein